MNIRISKNQIRFRITKEELGFLEEGEKVFLQSPLSSSSKGYFVEVSGSSESLIIKESTGNLILLVSKKFLSELKQKLPSKDGLENEILLNDQMIRIALEVDVKRR
ncbi:MAG: hypothetical protein KBC84_10080 [Proteobacteria bacterium]|nr:hypothetical protein [Pseudomonadota bacterium]